jgi:hypothetical protein
MLSSVDFDDNELFPANEAANVTADRLLPDELASIDLPVAKAIPEFRFGVGLVGAQLPRPEGSLNRATHCLAAHPDRKSDPTSPRKRAGRG